MNKILLIFTLLLLSFCQAQSIIQDDFIIETLSNKNLEKPNTNINYNYLSTEKIAIPLKITKTVKSEKDLFEGQILEFKVTKTITKRGKIITRKDQIAKARVETIVKNGMNGIPASIVLGNFKIEGLDENKLSTNYEKFGADLSLIVFPLKWALTILPPTGSLTNFIKGGHAKLKENKEFEVYYYPNW